jgi:HrpA-like RNA helicase
MYIDPAILALQPQVLQAPLNGLPHPINMNLRVGPAGANGTVRVGGVPVQQPGAPQSFGQTSVRVSGMPLPPPPRVDHTPVAAAPAAPQGHVPPVSRSIQPDDALVHQFLERYAHQDEHAGIDVGATVGFLDVDACLAVIAANDVTFVVTDTGTGKSSLVPKALMDIPGARIANSQPRRTAAVNLANRVAHLRNEAVGTNVGYWVRGEHCGDTEKCQLMYMTSYTLLLHIMDRHENMNFTHIIIDEFHERQPDVEVMLGLLKLAVVTKRWNVKIVLMSASVELELWKKYFDGLKVGEYSTCQPRYSIHDYYMEEVCRMVGAANTAQKLKDGTASSLELKNSLYLVKEMLKFLAQHAEPKDSILVFLPGRTVVEEIAQWVASNLAAQLDPIPWYRDMELAKIQANLRRPATTRKKVYLATDIAEVSLTLPDVVFVVDAGFTKKPRIDPAKRNSVVFPALEMLWCSRSSNRQRRGRVGRVQQGFFFTMMPEAYLPDLLEMEPQIANSTIHELALHTLQVCKNPIGCFNLCRVKPKDVALQLSMAVLQDGGYALKNDHPLAATEGTEQDVSKRWHEFVLSSEENKGLEGEMFVTTLKGRIAQRMPLNLESSTMVYLGIVFGLESLMVLAAAITSCGTPFYTTSDVNDRSQKQKAIKSTADIIKTYSLGLPSDVVAALGVTIAFKKQRVDGISEDGEEHWCIQNCVMRSRLGDILRLETQIKEQLSAQIPFVDINDPTEQEAMLKQHTPLVSMLSAGAHLERALFVQNDPRTAQREKRVGPSIFLGLDALSDLFVASACPWNVNSIVVPLSIQTKYGKLLGNFATQLSPKVFNVVLLLLAPQIVFELRQEEVLFGVELYGTKLRMRCDARSGNDIILVRQAICCKMSLLRHQMLQQVPPTDPSLDELIAASTIKLPPTVVKAASVSPFLRFIVGAIINTVTSEFGRDVAPSTDLTFRPQKWSVLVSVGSGILPYIPPAPPVMPPPALDGAAATFVENDES